MIVSLFISVLYSDRWSSHLGGYHFRYSGSYSGNRDADCRLFSLPILPAEAQAEWVRASVEESRNFVSIKNIGC